MPQANVSMPCFDPKMSRDEDPTENTPTELVPRSVSTELDELTGSKRAKYGRFVVAALGSIPWVGGVLSASAAFSAEADQARINELQRRWLEEHKRRLDELYKALREIVERLDQLGDAVDHRIQSDDYLGLVSQGFRTWDNSATEQKRRLVQQVLTNAAATSITSDDVVRLFIDWIANYHEIHFAVIRSIYRRPDSTRGQIWDSLRPRRPREDSADADLFKLLIRDLSTGGVIRQGRVTTAAGQFVKKPTPRGRRSGSKLMKSAFDDQEPYVLTQLGSQFVHYTMNEVVPRLS